MEIINFDSNIFLKFSEGNADFIFSTSFNDLDFNINKQTGRENINKLKDWFNLKDIGYLHQIHSNKVFIYDGKVYEGDSLITDKKNTAVGIFTADCVPILLYDKKNEIAAAVHSGWRGTISHIVEKTITTLNQKYNSDPKDIYAYIGPHIRSCCYEIGEEVAVQFKEDHSYKNLNVICDRKLNLEKCIIKQLSDKCINENHIIKLNLCTCCSKSYNFHSYRKTGIKAGRMFSFIYLK